MRYAKTHKQETREKVVKIAAKMLREKGPDGVGVAEVMREAGLTHGGFYAHFPSKDAFLTESLTEILNEFAERREKLTEGLSPREALVTYIESYVSTRHRDHPVAGCPLPALTSELPRQPKKFRAAFDEGTKRIVTWLAERMEASGIAHPDKVAVSTLSAMVGAIALARALSDRALSDALIESAKVGIKSQLGLAEASPRRLS